MVSRSIQVTNQEQLFQQADLIVDSIFPRLVSMRRHLHMHPELSWNEEHTTRYIADAIGDLGLELIPGPRARGGICEIRSQDYEAAPRIAVRGDIDAIPVFEENEVEYCSRYEDVMHACGHDVHATVLYGVTHALAELISRELVDHPVNMRAIFQPAEEVAEGAQEMIQHGALDGVAAILGMHVDSQRDVGTIGLRSHLQTACSDEVRVQISAAGGHAARPHETTDPILTAAQFINATYCQIPRSIDIRKSAVLTFCEVEGGKSANVIPTKVRIHGTLRTFDEEVRRTIWGQLKMLASHIGDAMGSEIVIEKGVCIPPVNNDPALIQLYRHAAATFLGATAVHDIAASMGGEDFACYQQHVPGALVRVGSANGEFAHMPLHSPRFDVDEEVIRVGCRLLLRTVLIWSRNGGPQP